MDPIIEDGAPSKDVRTPSSQTCCSSPAANDATKASESSNDNRESLSDCNNPFNVPGQHISTQRSRHEGQGEASCASPRLYTPQAYARAPEHGTGLAGVPVHQLVHLLIGL